MKNPLAHISLRQVFSRKNITIAALGTLAMIIVLACVTGYYYLITPQGTIIVTSAPFPAGLSTNFTPDNLTDSVVAHLNKMIEVAESGVINDVARQEGLGPRS